MPWTLEQIGQTRQTFAELKFRREAVDLNLLEGQGKTAIVYFLIPHSWAEERRSGIPHNFAMRMTPPADVLSPDNTLNEMTLFGVSDEVPVKFRPFVMTHEIGEYVALPMRNLGNVESATDTVSNGCALCSASEWGLVLEAFESPGQREYRDMRLTFFDDLVRWTTSNDGFSPQAIVNFQASLTFWSQLQL